MDRATLITLMVLFPALGILNMIFHNLKLRRFNKEVPQIEKRMHLERLKREAKAQMYAALVQIVLLGLPFVFFIYGMWKGLLSFGDVFLYGILPSVASIIVGQACKGTEKIAKSQWVEDPRLRKERDEVVYTWDHKAFPDW